MPSIGRQHGAISVRLTFTRCFAQLFLIPDKLYSAVRIKIGVNVAWPACGLCIIRRLYYIASPTAVTTTRAEVRCRIASGVEKDHSNTKTSVRNAVR